MNKQTCDKIKLLLWGLGTRVEENRDYIKSITFAFKSGLKTYEGIYSIDQNLLNFNGKDVKLDFIQLVEYVQKEALQYDQLEFTIEERGQTTILSADNKSVRTKAVDKVESAVEEHAGSAGSTSSKLLNRNYLVKIGEADQLLKEIGILTKEGKVKNDMIRKYNQIDHFVELIDKMIDDLPPSDTINILDCGCGKSYLTFVLNYYIKEKKKRNCYFIGIDRAEKVIEASKAIAGRLGYRNMEFISEDLNFYEPERRVDMVISLHACDIATDMALGLAVRVNAKAIVCVPCCHKELLEQLKPEELEPLLRQGVFKARFADLLTDSTRCLILEAKGYKVSAVEYISPLETPKNLLIRAWKTSNGSSKATLEYNTLKEQFGIRPFLENLIDL